jgi:post-segregation antitoxin (ccd killing protein)
VGKNLTLTIPEPVKKRAKESGLNMSKLAVNAIKEAISKLDAPLPVKEKKP